MSVPPPTGLASPPATAPVGGPGSASAAQPLSPPARTTAAAPQRLSPEPAAIASHPEPVAGSAGGPTADPQGSRSDRAAAGPAASAASPPPPTREAALTLLLRQGEATAAELAGCLGVSVQVMRRHLRSLEEDGLVEASSSHDRPGRPSNRWHLTSQGHDRFPDGSEQFAVGLLQSISDSLPPETLRLLLGQQASQKAALYRRRIGAGPLAKRLERLVELRRSEGYVAELHRDAGSDAAAASPAAAAADAWILSEFHCSVMRIAEEFPLICDQELQLIRHTFPDCQVERVHWRLEEGHSCGFRLSPVPGQL